MTRSSFLKLRRESPRDTSRDRSELDCNLGLALCRGATKNGRNIEVSSETRAQYIMACAAACVALSFLSRSLL
jgi:hypothetical protein